MSLTYALVALLVMVAIYRLMRVEGTRRSLAYLAAVLIGVLWPLVFATVLLIMAVAPGRIAKSEPDPDPISTEEQAVDTLQAATDALNAHIRATNQHN